MKKYRTFGELLAFIRNHIDELNRENVIFSISFNDEEKVLNSTPGYVLTMLYSIEQILGLVIDVVEVKSDYLNDIEVYLLIKVLI